MKIRTKNNATANVTRTMGFKCCKCGKMHIEGIKYNSNNTFNYVCIDCWEDVAIANTVTSSNSINSKAKKNGFVVTVYITLNNYNVNNGLKAVDNGYNVTMCHGLHVVNGTCQGFSSAMALVRELKKTANIRSIKFDVMDENTKEHAFGVPMEHKDLFVRNKWTVARYNKEYGAK